MSQYKIEDNVPIPVPPRKRDGDRISVLLSMKPGQSFFKAGVWAGTAEYYRIATACHGLKKRAGKKFTYKTVTENGVRGLRVWCVEGGDDGNN
jgi:hypothetical protein